MLKTTKYHSNESAFWIIIILHLVSFNLSILFLTIFSITFETERKLLNLKFNVSDERRKNQLISISSEEKKTKRREVRL